MTEHKYIKALAAHYFKLWELRKEFENNLLQIFTKELGDEFGFGDASLHDLHAEILNKYPDMGMKEMEQMVDWGLLHSLGTLFDVELEEVKKFFAGEK